ncbi:MAG: 30S ribosomal protein S8e [Candidatus Aenigmarchaeota archaeon]|nr:30S ribosomal protein S8e [Candidatus Aenigmarchaeota archaeon]
MAEWHLRSRRAPTGKLLHPLRKKRRQDRGLEFLETAISPRKARPTRALGGRVKQKLLSAEVANVVDPQTHRAVQAKIITVQGNPANPHYIRRNILTRGAIIKTDKGLARVTSRPGQDGVVNAVLVQEKKGE